MWTETPSQTRENSSKELGKWKLEWENGARIEPGHIFVRLFSYDLDQHALAAAAIELAVENLLPRAEIELPFRNRDHDLAPHHLAFEMGVRIVFAGAIMTVMADRLVRSQLFEPYIVVVMQAAFVVIDEHRRGGMRCHFVT